MADVTTRICFVCHRERAVDKFEGRRCADRDGCFRAAARAKPVTVPKRVLRKQFGNVIE
jgi:hypothetical protein